MVCWQETQTIPLNILTPSPTKEENATLKQSITSLAMRLSPSLAEPLVLKLKEIWCDSILMQELDVKNKSYIWKKRCHLKVLVDHLCIGSQACECLATFNKSLDYTYTKLQKKGKSYKLLSGAF